MTQSMVNTTQFFIDQSDSFLESVRLSIEGWKNQAIPASKSKKDDLSLRGKRPKYRQFEQELEDGDFVVEEIDRFDINLLVDQKEKRSILRKDRFKHPITTRNERFKRNMKLYTNEPTISTIMSIAHSQAKDFYSRNMKDSCNALLENQRRLVKNKEQIKEKLTKNPSMRNEKRKLLDSRFNTPPPRSPSFTRIEILKKINEITNDLRDIKTSNDDIEEQTFIIGKAKASLELELSNFEVSLNFEKEQFAEAQNRLRLIKGDQSGSQKL